MNSDTRLTILVLALAISYLSLIRFGLWWLLQSFARRFLLGAAVAAGTWALLHILTKGDKTFSGWFFSDSAEFTLDAMVSSILMMLIALAALLNGLRPAIPPWQRLLWLIPTGFFFFMGMDEYYSIHESIDSWRYLYIGGGMLLFIISLILAALERDYKILLFISVGAGLIGVGGVALDAFANEVYLEAGGHKIEWFICRRPWHGIECQSFGVIEEMLELLGESTILAGFLSFAQRHQPPIRWRLTRRASAVVTAVWAVWMGGSLWIAPTVEAQIWGKPVDVEYLDGVLALDHYELSRDVAAPGDKLDVSLFFHTGEFIHDNYYLSVHLLSQTDAASLAQDDLLLGEWEYPTSAWIPYLSVKNTVHLPIPADLPTPASYWITVRVWGGPDLTPRIKKPPDYRIVSREIEITKTDRRALTSDTVILYGLPVLGGKPDSAPPTASSYRFDNGMEIYGYDLPATAEIGQPLTMRFWWKTHRDIRAYLTQYLHLIEDGSDNLFVFDQLGFDSTFPFSDWPDGIDAVDNWSITLPADIPPGTYRVYTGVYHTPTVERIPVKDRSGQPIQDNSIFLGTIEIR